MQEEQTRGGKIARVLGGKKAWTLKAYTLHIGGVALFAVFPVHPFSAHRARSLFSNPSLFASRFSSVSCMYYPVLSGRKSNSVYISNLLNNIRASLLRMYDGLCWLYCYV